jgi:hypothetical protein
LETVNVIPTRVVVVRDVQSCLEGVPECRIPPAHLDAPADVAEGTALTPLGRRSLGLSFGVQERFLEGRHLAVSAQKRTIPGGRIAL